ncbi:MAG TPA: hypothetical protein VIU15_39710 [Streptomyces sp.]
MAAPYKEVWQGIRVPWITPWTSEQHHVGELRRLMGRGGAGLGYRDEQPHVDRNRDGVLWVRPDPGSIRSGRPQFTGVHPLRQRQAMDRMLCQVCGLTVWGTREDERALWVLRSGGRPIAEGETTTAPPVHEACALQAVNLCPHLRQGWVAALVGWTPCWGVAGFVYDPVTLTLVAGSDDTMIQIPYEAEQRLRWVVAAAEVVSLHEVEPIDLARLEAEAQAAAPI